MLQTQPRDLADAFTLPQIEERITSIMSAIGDAEASLMDSFDDMQASQKVRRQNLDDLYATLAVWVKAKNILTGAPSSTAELIAAQFNPTRQRY